MKIEELMNLTMFQMSRIMLSAVELEFFPLLNEPQSSADVAKALDLDPGATLRLLNAITSMGVLQLSDGKYVVPEEFREILGDGPGSVLPMFRHRARLWKVWSSLTDSVRTGKTHYALNDPEFDQWDGMAEFTRAMAVSGWKIAGEAVAELDLDGVTRVLDIGGGPGIYAIEFCRARPDLRVCILDNEGVQEVASEFINDAGYQEKIYFYSGDALEVDIDDVIGKGKFDIVFMSNLIHAMSEDSIHELYRRCAEWCTPGGRIVVKDFFLDDTRTEPQRAAVFAINMLVATTGGNSYTWTETEDWLNELTDSSDKNKVTGLSRKLLSDGYSGMVIAEVK